MKIGVGVLLVVLLTVLLLSFVSLKNMGEVLIEAETRELKSYYNQVISEIGSEGRVAEVMSALIANIPSVQQAFADGDRDTLANMLVPSFKILKANPEYAARQFQFHTPPATSFLRVHKPQKFGDDLSSFRKTVVKTNTDRKPIRGLEKGVAGLGVRGMVPVTHNDKHLGSLEFGMSFGQPFFESYKQKSGIDLALHMVDSSGLKTFASTLPDGLGLSSNALKQGKNSITSVVHHELNEVPYTQIAGPVKDFSGKVIGVLEIAMDRSYYASALANQRNEALMTGLIAILLGVAFSFLLTRTISKPICDVVAALNDIAAGEGDLTRRLDESGRDELSRLGRAFNKFVIKIQAVISDVMSSTQTLSASATEMSSVTEETSRGVERQQSGIEQVATAINEMSASVQEVARNTMEAAESANHADDQAKQMQVIVDNTVSSVTKLANEVERIGSVINDLQDQTTNIDTVLDVIKGIAEQTNLLALNAAIEAARAGEQGRGFAVVADEVRTLASRTQESTQEIQGIIETLQGGARSAVDAMENGRNDANETADQAREAGTSLLSITAAIASISEMNTQIAASAREQSSVAEEVNENISTISVQAEVSAEGAQQTKAASEELSRLANHLQSLVSQFKV